MFWLCIVFIFTLDPKGIETSANFASRQVQTKIAPTDVACRKDALAALNLETPDGVVVGVKCDGPFSDPTVTKLLTGDGNAK